MTSTKSFDIIELGGALYDQRVLVHSSATSKYC